MNYFEFLKKKIDETIQGLFAEIPELTLDLTEEEWEQYHE